MNEVILTILGIAGIFISLYVLYNMPASFLNEFEKKCHDKIKERDEQIIEKEKTNKELRKWFFN